MKALFFVLSFFIIALLINGCSNQTESAETSKYDDITSEQLKAMIENEGEKVYVADVHIPEQEHIKGTDAFIPYNEIGKNLDKLPSDKNAAIALYCRSGSMSREAAETLASLGYTNVYNQLGGANDWREKGFEFQ